MKVSYNKNKIKVYTPQEWYNILYHKYSDYHKDLDQWEKWMFTRFLPENLTWLNIVDLWSWDWRLVKYFKWAPLNKYVCCDIADKLLKRIRWNVEKVVCNLEEPLPFNDWEFDVALSFFVLLHIENIQWLLEEVYRILKPGGRFIVLHHIELRPFEYNINWEKFKIQNYTHKYDNLEKLADYCFFWIDNIELFVRETLVWKVYCFTKK